MQEQHIGITGGFQQIHRHFKGGEQFHPFGDLVFFAHGSPDIAVDHIGVFHGGDIIGYFDHSAGGGGHFIGGGQHFFIDFKRRGAVSHKVHAHFGAAVHPGVAHIIADIAAENHFHLGERFRAMLFDGEHIR